MKFGKALETRESPLFKGQYLRYKLLKKILKTLDANRKAGEQSTEAQVKEASSRFVAALQEVSGGARDKGKRHAWGGWGRGWGRG